MDNPFKYLRDAEWQTLSSNAEVRRFEPGEVLLESGTKPGGIMVVRSGTVNVCKGAAGFNLVVAEHGAGAVFGEMSFIEAIPAEVSLVASTPVEVLYITHGHVQVLIRDNPAFFGRFFQSLAYLLSRRLRETTGRIGKQPADDWLTED